MYKMRIAVAVALALAAVLVHVHDAEARPYRIASRQKRISDQRLAELETLIALTKMKNKMVTIPVGFGRVDPLKIGRRKRTVNELIKNLVADLTSHEDREQEDNTEEADKASTLSDDSDSTPRYLRLPVRLPE